MSKITKLKERYWKWRFRIWKEEQFLILYRRMNYWTEVNKNICPECGQKLYRKDNNE